MFSLVGLWNLDFKHELCFGFCNIVFLKHVCYGEKSQRKNIRDCSLCIVNNNHLLFLLSLNINTRAN